MIDIGDKLADYMDEDHEAWIESEIIRTQGLEWAKHVDPEEAA